tara:strand:+ start:6067 stop:6300 length:234 start_codon:yes stop_codon:yes gene_type:complete
MKTPTAKDIFHKIHEEELKLKNKERLTFEQRGIKAAIELANIHVKLALEAASKTDYVQDSDSAKQAILNCYTLTNIK